MSDDTRAIVDALLAREAVPQDLSPPDAAPPAFPPERLSDVIEAQPAESTVPTVSGADAIEAMMSPGSVAGTAFGVDERIIPRDVDSGGRIAPRIESGFGSIDPEAAGTVEPALLPPSGGTMANLGTGGRQAFDRKAFDTALEKLVAREAAFRLQSGSYDLGDVRRAREGDSTYLSTAPLRRRIRQAFLAGQTPTGPDLGPEYQAVLKMLEAASPGEIPEAAALFRRAAGLGGMRQLALYAGKAADRTDAGPVDREQAARSRLAAATAELEMLTDRGPAAMPKGPARPPLFQDSHTPRSRVPIPKGGEATIGPPGSMAPLVSDPLRLMDLNRRRARRGLAPLEELPGGPAGPGEVLQEKYAHLWEKIPFLGAVFTAARLWDVYSAAKRAEEGKASIDDWEALAAFQEELAREARGTTFLGGATDIAAESVPFAIEFLASGGLLNLGKEGAKEGTEKGVLIALRRLATGALHVGKQTALRAPFFSQRVAAGTIERMLPRMSAELIDGQPEMVVVEEGQDFGSALRDAGMDTLIEIYSEQTGQVFGAIGAKVRGGLAKAGISPVRMEVRQFLERAGFHGVLEEVGEERIGELLREAATRLGAADLPQDVPSLRQIAQETVAFSAMPGAARAADYVRGKATELKHARGKAQYDQAVAEQAEPPIVEPKQPETEPPVGTGPAGGEAVEAPPAAPAPGPEQQSRAAWAVMLRAARARGKNAAKEGRMPEGAGAAVWDILGESMAVDDRQEAIGRLQAEADQAFRDAMSGVEASAAPPPAPQAAPPRRPGPADAMKLQEQLAAPGTNEQQPPPTLPEPPAWFSEAFNDEERVAWQTGEVSSQELMDSWLEDQRELYPPSGDEIDHPEGHWNAIVRMHGEGLRELEEARTRKPKRKGGKPAWTVSLPAEAVWEISNEGRAVDDRQRQEEINRLQAEADRQQAEGDQPTSTPAPPAGVSQGPADSPAAPAGPAPETERGVRVEAPIEPPATPPATPSEGGGTAPPPPDFTNATSDAGQVDTPGAPGPLLPSGQRALDGMAPETFATERTEDDIRRLRAAQGDLGEDRQVIGMAREARAAGRRLADELLPEFWQDVETQKPSIGWVEDERVDDAAAEVVAIFDVGWGQREDDDAPVLDVLKEMVREGFRRRAEQTRGAAAMWAGFDENARQELLERAGWGSEQAAALATERWEDLTPGTRAVIVSMRDEEQPSSWPIGPAGQAAWAYWERGQDDPINDARNRGRQFLDAYRRGLLGERLFQHERNNADLFGAFMAGMRDADAAELERPSQGLQSPGPAKTPGGWAIWKWFNDRPEIYMEVDPGYIEEHGPALMQEIAGLRDGVLVTDDQGRVVLASEAWPGPQESPRAPGPLSSPEEPAAEPPEAPPETSPNQGEKPAAAPEDDKTWPARAFRLLKTNSFMRAVERRMEANAQVKAWAAAPNTFDAFFLTYDREAQRVAASLIQGVLEFENTTEADAQQWGEDYDKWFENENLRRVHAAKMYKAGQEGGDGSDDRPDDRRGPGGKGPGGKGVPGGRGKPDGGSQPGGGAVAGEPAAEPPKDVREPGKPGNVEGGRPGRPAGGGDRVPPAGAEGGAAAGGVGAGGGGLPDDAGGGAAGHPGGRDAVTADGDGGLSDYAFDQNLIDYLEAPQGGIGALTRARNNLEAIRLVKELERERRAATDAEKAVLARYVGWGFSGNSLGGYSAPQAWREIQGELRNLLTDDEYRDIENSTLNAHYTTPTVALAIHETVRDMGFTSGRMLEPAVGGNGVFLGMLPRQMRARTQRVAVELDGISAAIARALYGKTDVRGMGYEEFQAPAGFFDLVVSNVPFDNEIKPLHDVLNPRGRLNLHNFFLVKALHETRPGGIVAIITTSGMMNSAGNAPFRSQIDEVAEFLGAVRLPNTAFAKIANTRVVADIVFFQRRGPGVVSREIPWTATAKGKYRNKLNETVEVGVSEYFLAHPEQVVGTPSAAGEMRGRGAKAGQGEYTVDFDGTAVEFEDALRAALKRLPRDVVTPRGATAGPALTQGVNERDPEQRDTREGDFVLVDGNVFLRQGKQLIPLKDLGGNYDRRTTVKRFKLLIPIRDTARELLAAQMADPDADLTELQTRLAEQYDAHVKLFGYINAPHSQGLHRRDPVLLAVEDYDKRTKIGKKTALFAKRVFERAPRPTSAASVVEALGISLNETATVDPERIGELVGRPAEIVMEELSDEAQVFLDPSTETWQPADQYLSGADLYSKLAEAETAAELDGRFAPNVEALRAVIPPVKPPALIEYEPGMHWIPIHVLQDFADFTFGGHVRITHIPETSEFMVSKELKTPSVLRTWAIRDGDRVKISGLKLLELCLNNKTARIYNPKPHRDAKATINEKLTLAAQQRQWDLRQTFREYCQKGPYAQELANQFNRMFNGARRREFDGSHLTLPGKNPEIDLYSYQLNDVWRIMASGQHVLEAAQVGMGKTFILAAAAMETKRVGVANKTLIVVPGHMVAQWPAHFRELYPNANLLVGGQEISGTPAKKPGFLGQIAVADYDAIIVNYELFEYMALSEGEVQRYFQARVRDLEIAIEEVGAEKGKESKRTVKKLAAARMKLIAQMKKRLGELKQDKRLTFEELGINQVFFDEPHEKVKNLGYGYSAMAGDSVKGLGDVQGSAIAFHTHMVTEYLTRINNGRGIVFATGTPIKNSMAEVYTLMRYLWSRGLQRLGIHHLDAWSKMFAQPTPSFEVGHDGRHKWVIRLQEFTSIAQLSRIFSTFTAFPPDDARQEIERRTGQKLPRVKTNSQGKADFEAVVCDPPPQLFTYMQDLQNRMDHITGKKSPRPDQNEDNALKVLGDGKKAAIHLPMILPEAPQDWPTYKLSVTADLVAEKFAEFAEEKGLILVFQQLGVPNSKKPDEEQLYELLREQIVERGVPYDQIEIVHEARNDDERQAMLGRLWRGESRVLITSAAKGGTGLNVQRLAKVLITVDPPFTPAEVEQAIGRIVRQGNSFDEVELYRMVTTGSVDAFMYQLLQAKDGFTAQFVRGRVTDEMGTYIDVDPDKLATYGLAKALASDNAALVALEEARVNLMRLELQRQHHVEQQEAMKRSIERAPQREQHLQAALELYRRAAAVAEAADSEFAFETGGAVLTKRPEAGQVLVTAASELGVAENKVVGTFKGFKVRVMGRRRAVAGQPAPFDLLLDGESVGGGVISKDPTGSARVLENAVGRIAGQVAVLDKELADHREDVARMRKEIGTPFGPQVELDRLRTEVARLRIELNMESEGPDLSMATADDQDALETALVGEDDASEDEPDVQPPEPEPPSETPLPRRQPAPGTSEGRIADAFARAYRTAEEMRWVREHRDVPTFGIGGMANLPEVRTRWQEYYDRVSERLQALPPGLTQRVMDGLGIGLFGVEEWGVPGDVKDALRERRGRIGRGQRDIERYIQDWDKWHDALAVELGQPVAGGEQVPEIHRLFEQVIRGERPDTVLNAAGRKLVMNFRQIMGEISQEILQRVELHPWFELRLKNWIDVVRGDLEEGTYLRTVVRGDDSKLNERTLLPFAFVGPRMRIGPLMEKRTTGLWNVRVQYSESLTHAWSFDDEAEAVDFWEQKTEEFRPLWGESVKDRVIILDPIPEEWVERARQSGKIGFDVREMMRRSVVDNVINLETAKLMHYVRETVAFTRDQLPDSALDMGYRKLPDKQNLGPLSGLYVPDYIARNLYEFGRVKRHLALTVYETWLSLWKSGKVVVNPPTWFRAALGNQMFGILDGIHPVTHAQWFRKALDHIRTESDVVRSLYDAGVMSGYFNEDLRAAMAGISQAMQDGRFKTILGAIGKFTKRTIDTGGEWYDWIDRIWKVASYLYHTEAQGWSHEEAVARINGVYPNYARAGRFARFGSKWLIGSPFFMFADASMKAGLWGIRNRPLTMLALMTFPGLLTLSTVVMLGVDPDELALMGYPTRWHALLDVFGPQYFRPLIPIRDANGHVMRLDMRWIHIWADFFQYQTGPNGIELPFVLSNPLPRSVVEAWYGREMFSGRQIFGPDEPLETKAGKAFLNLLRQSTPLPSVVTHTPARVLRAMRGESSESVMQALAGGVFGVNLRPATISRQDAYRQIREAAGDEDGARFLDLMDTYNEHLRREEDEEITLRSVLRSIERQERQALEGD